MTITAEQHQAALDALNTTRQSVDDLVEFGTEQVGQMQAWDERVVAAEDQVEDLVTNRAQIMGTGLGALTLGVAAYATQLGGAGYLHLKLPILSSESEMVALKFRGYGLYLSSKLINDEVGFYVSNDNPSYISSTGDHQLTIYSGSDGNIYVRLTIDDFYFLTVAVDATQVGNGRLLTVGSCEFIRSEEEQL